METMSVSTKAIMAKVHTVIEPIHHWGDAQNYLQLSTKLRWPVLWSAITTAVRKWGHAKWMLWSTHCPAMSEQPQAPQLRSESVLFFMSAHHIYAKQSSFILETTMTSVEIIAPQELQCPWIRTAIGKHHVHANGQIIRCLIIGPSAVGKCLISMSLNGGFVPGYSDPNFNGFQNISVSRD